MKKNNLMQRQGIRIEGTVIGCIVPRLLTASKILTRTNEENTMYNNPLLFNLSNAERFN